jgi:hypothetical protein
MWKILTSIRKKLWLTKHERWVMGWAYARQEIYNAQPNQKGAAIVRLMENPLEYDHPFDQGILAYCEEYLKTERKYR